MRVPIRPQMDPEAPQFPPYCCPRSPPPPDIARALSLLMRMPSMVGSSRLSQRWPTVSLLSLSRVPCHKTWANEQAAAAATHSPKKPGTPSTLIKVVPTPHRTYMLRPRCKRLPWANELLTTTHQRPSLMFSAELMKFCRIRSEYLWTPLSNSCSAVNWQKKVPQQRATTPPTIIFDLLRAQTDSGL